MTDTASTQLLPTYISSLAERLNNLEALLADRTHRQAIEQRAVILERNDIVRDLLLRGETLAHIGRVLNIQREPSDRLRIVCRQKFASDTPRFVIQSHNKSSSIALIAGSSGRS